MPYTHIYNSKSVSDENRASKRGEWNGKIEWDGEKGKSREISINRKMMQ